MLRLLALAASLLLFAAPARAFVFEGGPTRGAFADRPACAAGNEGQRYVVTDCADGTCVAGGGAVVAATDCIDAAWQLPGTGGSGPALATDGEINAAKAINAADPRVPVCTSALVDRDGDGALDYACVADWDGDGELQDDLRSARNALVWPSGTLTTAPKVTLEIAPIERGRTYPLAPPTPPNGPYGQFLRFCADSTPPTGETEPDCTGDATTPTSHPDLELLGFGGITWEWTIEADDLYPGAARVVGTFAGLRIGDYIADGSDAVLFETEMDSPFWMRFVAGDTITQFVPIGMFATIFSAANFDGVCGRVDARLAEGAVWGLSGNNLGRASVAYVAQHPDCSRLDVIARNPDADGADTSLGVVAWAELDRTYISGDGEIDGVQIVSGVPLSQPEFGPNVCAEHPQYASSCNGPSYTAEYDIRKPANGDTVVTVHAGGSFEGTIVGRGSNDAAVCRLTRGFSQADESFAPLRFSGFVSGDSTAAYTCRFMGTRTVFDGILEQRAAVGTVNENNPWLAMLGSAAASAGTAPPPIYPVELTQRASFWYDATADAAGMRPLSECHNTGDVAGWITAPSSQTRTFSVPAIANDPSTIASNGSLPDAVCARRDGTGVVQCGAVGAATTATAFFAPTRTWITGIEIELLEDYLTTNLIDVGLVVDTKKDKSGAAEPWDEDGADNTVSTADDGIQCTGDQGDLFGYMPVGRAEIRNEGDTIKLPIGMYAEAGEAVEVAIKNATSTTLCAAGAACATATIPAMNVTVHYFDIDQHTRLLP